MDSKLKYLIIFFFLIVAIIAIMNIFPQLEFNLWSPIRFFLKYNILYSFITVTLFSLILGIISSMVSYKVLDLPRLKRYQIEVRKWKAQEQNIKKLKAAGTPNKKLELKIKRKKKYIEKIQREIASERMKPTLFTMVPFMIIFLVLNGFIFTTASGIIVAIFPFNIYKIPLVGGMTYLSPITSTSGLLSYFVQIPPLDLGGGINLAANYFFKSIFQVDNGCYIYFIGWYFISTFGFNSILQRVFGLNLET